MKKNQIFVNDDNGTLVITKAFYKKACVFGSDEYYALRKAKAETGFEVAFKFEDKDTHGGLSFKRMEAYIQTQPKAEERLIEFEAVKRIAKVKGAMYPLTKKWFFLTYPEYKDNSVSEAEKAEEAKRVAAESAKKAEAEAAKKIASIVEQSSDNEDIFAAA